MSVGGAFLLLIVVVVLVVGGVLFVAIARRGRARQLSSKGGTLDARRPEDGADEKRPEHVEVESEQRSRFIGTR